MEKLWLDEERWRINKNMCDLGIMLKINGYGLSLT